MELSCHYVAQHIIRKLFSILSKPEKEKLASALLPSKLKLSQSKEGRGTMQAMQVELLERDPVAWRRLVERQRRAADMLQELDSVGAGSVTEGAVGVRNAGPSRTTANVLSEGVHVLGRGDVDVSGNVAAAQEQGALLPESVSRGRKRKRKHVREKGRSELKSQEDRDNGAQREGVPKDDVLTSTHIPERQRSGPSGAGRGHGGRSNFNGNPRPDPDRADMHLIKRLSRSKGLPRDILLTELDKIKMEKAKTVPSHS